MAGRSPCFVHAITNARMLTKGSVSSSPPMRGYLGPISVTATTIAPAISPLNNVSHMVGYDRATDNGLINFQLGAPIPFRNKNCGNIAAARADYARAIENVKRIELALKSRLARSAQEFESANASVQKYDQEILPQAKESLDLSEKAYRAGELAFLQVLTVRRNYYDSNIRFIQAQG